MTSTIIRCDTPGCTGEAKILMLENRPPKLKVGPVTVWFYDDGCGHILIEQTRLDLGPLRGKCPRCLDAKPK